jgi:hypothetical protein
MMIKGRKAETIDGIKAFETTRELPALEPGAMCYTVAATDAS